MVNHTEIVGRIVNDIQKEDNTVTLKVDRLRGDYGTDIITCRLGNLLAQSIAEYCKKGDLVGIKGRLQSKEVKTSDTTTHMVEVVGEKFTFISPKNKEKED